MPAPRLTWNPDEAKQSLEVAAAIDAAAKDATRRERARCEAIVQAKLDKLVSADMLVALAEIRDPERYTRQTSGVPAPEAKS